MKWVHKSVYKICAISGYARTVTTGGELKLLDKEKITFTVNIFGEGFITVNTTFGIDTAWDFSDNKPYISYYCKRNEDSTYRLTISKYLHSITEYSFERIFKELIEERDYIKLTHKN